MPGCDDVIIPVTKKGKSSLKINLLQTSAALTHSVCSYYRSDHGNWSFFEGFILKIMFLHI